MESAVLQKAIETRLSQYIDEYLQKDLLSAKALRAISVDGNKVAVDICLGYPLQSHLAQKKQELETWLQPAIPGYTLTINLTTNIQPHAGNQGIPGFTQVKNIIAVASGKGGVGKSTVSVNLALALAKEGARVGILDADIYGPSQPLMLGTKGTRPVINEKIISPVIKHGVQSMSIGYLVDELAALAWRGPMLGKALQQLINDTKWDDLDYLIIDLPPGTGDVQLTMCQKIPVSGAVIVTTPQDMALADVRRACEMFKKLNVPILGVVENMSMFACSNCGHQEHIFGVGGGEKLAKDYDVAFLGKLPLNLNIREMTDSGNPPVVQAPESDVTKSFLELARRTAAKLALQKKDYSSKFTNIQVVKENRG